MAPEVGDPDFARRLDKGYAEATARLPKADSYEGYVAVMAAFGNGMADKHIWARQDLVRRTVEWPGVVIALRGRTWTVVAQDDKDPAEKLVGARLVSCDGTPAEEYARQRLATFRAVWSVPAQRINAAPWLLVDDENPFLPRAESCSFDVSGRQVAVKLPWRSISRPDYVAKATAAAPRGEPGFGVRPFAGGTWIALESLDNRAAPLVEEIEKDPAKLRSAPMVVLDLRGNGGGSSAYGRRIADAIYGPAFTAAKLGAAAEEEGCGSLWRASRGNLEQLDIYMRDLAPKVGPEFAAEIARSRVEVVKALAEHRAIAGDVAACKARAAAQKPATAAAPAPFYQGKMVLLTDSACFSSCLLTTDYFRKLGARHVGEATDANTHYMEVREAWLPSGLTRFSTLQAVGLDSPLQIGPFEPSDPYPVDISDTKALEAWIAKLSW
jgi:hypothetical protein